MRAPGPPVEARRAPPPAESPAPPAPSPRPHAVANTLPQLRHALRDATDGKPSWSWLRSLELRRFADGVAVFAAQPGGRDMLKFATGRKHELAALVQSLVGRPVRVELEGASPTAAPPESDAAGDAAASGSQPAGPSALQQAMTLPLVKQVMEVFDATLIEVRREEPAPPAPQGAEPESDVDPAASDEPRP